MKQIGLIGFGRFGRFWAHHLAHDFPVFVTDSLPEARHTAAQLNLEFRTFDEVCRECDCLFICVPINKFEGVVRQIRPFLRPGMTILDVCSVKENPATVMKDNLAIPGVEVIATHPLFGPDSGRNGLNGLRLVMAPVSDEGPEYKYWRSYFKNLGLQVVEMSPADHDHLAAYSQGVTHYVGRILQRLELRPTLIDTKGFGMLLSVIDQTCNDTPELFQDLQTFNRFTTEMRRELDKAMRAVDSQLTASIQPSVVRKIGIQGGRGSFNEAACLQFCKSYELEHFEIVYLMRTEPVLESLQDGRIDRGVFALGNTRGGFVTETLDALTKYPCEILDRMQLVIRHCLATHSSVTLADIDTIVSHPQPLAQCAATLQLRFPDLKQVSTETEEFRSIAGRFYSPDLVDQATCARYLAEGKLPRNLALVVPQFSAEIFELKIHEKDLQGPGEENRTEFAWAKRRRYE